MAVETTGTDASFTGTGVSSTYSTGFYINTSDQIVVTVNGVLQTLGDDYVVNNVGASGGCDIVGNFTLGAAVYVERVTPITQAVDTQNNETILEDVLDAEFDKLTMIAQEINNKAGRALLFPKGESGQTIPAAASRAGRFPAFDALGALFMSAGTGNDPNLRTDLATTVGAALMGWALLATGAVARTVSDKLAETVSVADFGAKANAITKTTGSSTNASVVFTDVNAAWTTADVGKTISITGAGPAGGTLVTTIAGRNSATSINLAAAASATLANLTYTYGTDNSTAFEKARDYLQDGDGAGHGGNGGWILAKNGRYLITRKLAFGNGTSAGVPNTKPIVSLEGDGPVAGVGYASPANCAEIVSAVADPAVEFNGTLGWGLRKFVFSFATNSTAAMATSCNDVESGNMEDIVVLNCPGLVHQRWYSWGTKNLTLNHIKNIYVYMGAATPNNAIAIHLNALAGGTSDVALNTFENMHVQPGHATHVGLYLGYCDTNTFIRYDFNPLPGFLPAAAAVRFDYTAATGSGFPNFNHFFGGTPYTSPIDSVGTPSFPSSFCNVWVGLDLGNNAPVPTAKGFVAERIKLSGDTTFYVNPAGVASGSFGPGDATSFGVYQGRPCLTAQQAYDQIATWFDLNGFVATISAANGTYGAGINAVKPAVGGRVVFAGQGGGSVFTGVTAPFVANTGTDLEVQSVNLSPGAAVASVTANGGTLRVGAGVVFGSNAAEHVLSNNRGLVLLTGNYFINGGATAHLLARHGSTIQGSVGMTLLANVAITNYAQAKEAGVINGAGLTFTLGANTVTGTRYSATINGVIDSNGGGANFFPGTIAGATATGGQYA